MSIGIVLISTKFALFKLDIVSTLSDQKLEGIVTIMKIKTFLQILQYLQNIQTNEDAL